MIRILLLVGVVTLSILLRSAAVAVDYSEFAIVTRFGAPVETIDGGTGAGLAWKWPWPVDAVTRVDRRVQSLDLPAVESLTRDAAGGAVDKTLAVDAYLAWRVPDGDAAGRFARTLGDAEGVRRVLAPRAAARVADAVSASPADALLGVADDKTLEARAAAFRARVLGDPADPQSLPAQALGDYGVEILDLRVRRVRYPDAVRASIAERIRSERARKVAEYESEGRRRAADIASQAEADARLTEAQARADKARSDGKADAAADTVRADAAARDPEFYRFLQKLKAYRLMLADSRDTLLLSTRHPLFELLLGPPKGAAK